MITTYQVKGKDLGLEFLFKYDLNGVLIEFSKKHPLTEDQRIWLYSERFPETEYLMQQWIKRLTKVFEVSKVPADLSFENLWEQYNYKVSKADAIKAFNKIKDESDIVKCFIGLKPYEDHLARTKVGKAHLSRYINGRYFENEY